MKTHLLLFLILFSLAACNNSSSESNTPLPPTPTEVPISFTGPVLGNPTPSGADSPHAECSAESGCVSGNEAVVTEAAEALPLEMQTIKGMTVGVPAGYSAQVAGDEILISAVSVDEEGGFMVAIREAHQEEVARLTGRFNFEAGITAQNEGLTGTFVMRDGSSAVAILTAPDGRQFVVDALADPGYWLAFNATFREMLRTLKG